MKPTVICHMMMSVDGRIIGGRWNLSPQASAQYEQTHALLKANTWMCGRITMAHFAAGTSTARRTGNAAVPKTDFIAGRHAKSFALALDASGKLNWKSNAIGGDHLVCVLTKKVPGDYLASLRAKNISYLFAGKSQIDFRLALEKLNTHFGIKRLLLEGGGKINGSMLAAGVIDELSLLIAPCADGEMGTPTLFDVQGLVRKTPAAPLRLISVQKRPGGVLWLRYKL